MWTSSIYRDWTYWYSNTEPANTRQHNAGTRQIWKPYQQSSIKELSFCHKFNISNPFIFAIWWCKPLTFETKIIQSHRIHSLKKVYDIWLQRYKYEKLEFVARTQLFSWKKKQSHQMKVNCALNWILNVLIITPLLHNWI